VVFALVGRHRGNFKTTEARPAFWTRRIALFHQPAPLKFCDNLTQAEADPLTRRNGTSWKTLSSTWCLTVVWVAYVVTVNGRPSASPTTRVLRQPGFRWLPVMHFSTMRASDRKWDVRQSFKDHGFRVQASLYWLPCFRTAHKNVRHVDASSHPAGPRQPSLTIARRIMPIHAVPLVIK
jgi:hypothetical protein